MRLVAALSAVAMATCGRPAFEDRDRVVVVTYNIKHALMSSPRELADTISAADPDLVALQESSPAETRRIAELLDMEPHYTAWGLGVLADDAALAQHAYSLGRSRGVFAVELPSGLVFASTHLDTVRSERSEQSARLARILRREFDGDLVVAGDLNGDGADVQEVVDMFEERANHRIDHVLARGCAIIGSRTLQSDASDHLPVVAELSW